MLEIKEPSTRPHKQVEYKMKYCTQMKPPKNDDQKMRPKNEFRHA